MDLNCDLGESFGVYEMGTDAHLLDHVTSANIACGFHAGDPATMRVTVRRALEKGIAIGAHPGLPDLVGFGRREMVITPQEAYDLVVYQVGALQGFVHAEGGVMRHVKPHGALYNMAARQVEIAEAIAEAVYKVDNQLSLFGLAGSELIAAGRRFGLDTVNEVFADRTYQQDGRLTSRTSPHALITDEEIAAERVVRMVQTRQVMTEQGVDIPVQAETICIHGDGPHALAFARKIRQALEQADIRIQAPHRNP